MVKMISLQKVLSPTSYNKLFNQHPIYLNPRLKLKITKNVGILYGFESKPENADFLENLSKTIEQDTNRKSLALVYNHKNGGPKRNPNGGIDSEFIKLHKSSHKSVFKKLTSKEIGGFIFKWNQYTDFFNEANFLLHKAVSRPIINDCVKNVEENSENSSKTLVLDSMSGIGPLVLPFLKNAKNDSKNVKLLANDWNPSAIKSLKRNLRENSLDSMFNADSIFCEDSKTFLIREAQNENFDRIWVVMGGTPGVTEKEFLPLFLDKTISNKNGVPIVLTITGKNLDYIFEWLNEHRNSGKFVLNEPLGPLWIRSGSVTAFTMTFL